MTATQNANLAHHFLDLRIEEGLGPKVALRCGEQTWSYAQVQALSLVYAQTLKERGLRREDRVMIALPEGAPWVGVFFAVLRSGGIVVMANPQLRAQALADLAAYTRARVVIGNAQRLDEQTLQALHTTYQAQGLDAPQAFVPENPYYAGQAPPLHCVHSDPAESAIWLFSGGTTGTPKAVMQSHASFAFTTRAYAHQVLGLGPSDITISVPKLHFGYATGSNLLFPFSVGASCVLNPEPCKARALASLIHAHQATVLIHVPTMVAKMLDDPEIQKEQLGSLRLATSAGEALPAVVHQKWSERFGIELLDGLGTAEMWHIFLSNAPGKVRPGSLGQVVPGFEVRLCDDEGQAVPTGQPGWLWVKGGALANGYWLRPQKNQEAFLGDWYRSGDLLKRDEEGYFYYCGRSGDLIKVSGKWLAPADVEAALMGHPHVASAVVVGAPDASGLQKPYAFITLTTAGLEAFDEGVLRQHVADALEPYKSPRAVYVAKHWPQTHLGKADRNRLRALVGAIREGRFTPSPNSDARDFRLTPDPQAS